MPDTPCTPIPKVYPSGADSQQIACIDVAYSNYRVALATCSGSPTCCAAMTDNYKAAWTGCTGLPYPD